MRCGQQRKLSSVVGEDVDAFCFCAALLGRGDADRLARQTGGGGLRPELPEPLRLRREDSGLKLLQQIRDESHRFAVSRHRARRSARTLHSKLDELSGIGPRRRKLLLQKFGSVTGVRQAPLEELQAALGPAMGRKVFEQLRAGAGGARPTEAS